MHITTHAHTSYISTHIVHAPHIYKHTNLKVAWISHVLEADALLTVGLYTRADFTHENLKLSLQNE